MNGRRGGGHASDGLQGGTGQLVALLIAIGIVAVTFTIILQTARHQEDLASHRAVEDHEAAAARLAATLLGGPGAGWYADVECDGFEANASKLQPELVRRFGLGSECLQTAASTAFRLDFHKLRDAAQASFAADPASGHHDYEEARRGLGLADLGLDLHVRASPVLADVRETLRRGWLDPHLRAAYIGAYETLQGDDDEDELVHRVARACGWSPAALGVEVWVDVTNNGTAATPFEVTFEVPLWERSVVLVQHTGVVAPGATARASVALPRSADWRWAGAAQVGASVYDVERFLGGCTINLAGVSMSAATTARLYGVHAESLLSVLQGESVVPKVRYAAYDGMGGPVAMGTERLDVRTSLGLSVALDTSLHPRGWEAFTLVLPDAYQVHLTTALGTSLAKDTLNLASTAVAPFTPSLLPVTVRPQEPVAIEVAQLAALLASFDPYVYAPEYHHDGVPYAPGGDVFPDLKRVLNEDLAGFLTDRRGTPQPNDDAPTLAAYNVIVVGSNADHRAMTSEAAKQSIRDWVYAGGYLIVLGSVEQAVQWLQPIFHSAIESASQPLFTPDPSHPLLHTPNDLAYEAFDSGRRAWHYQRADEAGNFGHVVVSGTDDVLAVSNAGAFGDGRVLLTAYQPYDLLGQGAAPCATADCPALAFVQNLLTYAYRELYIDFGPPIPGDRPVGTAQRLATVRHPELGADVELVVFVYLF